VATGVRTLGINRIGDHLDEGLKQALLLRNQLAGFQGYRRTARKGPAEGDLVGIGSAIEPEHQRPQHRAIPLA